MLKLILALLAVTMALPVTAGEPAPPPQSDEPPPAIRHGDTDRHRNIVVALKSRDEDNPKPLSEEWQQRIAEAAGMPLEYVRLGGGDWHVFRLPHRTYFDEADEVCARIRQLPEVLYAHPSVLVRPLLVPTDRYLSASGRVNG